MAKRSLQVSQLGKLIAYQNSLDMQLKNLKKHLRFTSQANVKVVIEELKSLEMECTRIGSLVRKLANKLHVKLFE